MVTKKVNKLLSKSITNSTVYLRGVRGALA